MASMEQVIHALFQILAKQQAKNAESMTGLQRQLAVTVQGMMTGMNGDEKGFGGIKEAKAKKASPNRSCTNDILTCTWSGWACNRLVVNRNADQWVAWAAIKLNPSSKTIWS